MQKHASYKKIVQKYIKNLWIEKGCNLFNSEGVLWSEINALILKYDMAYNQRRVYYRVTITFTRKLLMAEALYT